MEPVKKIVNLWKYETFRLHAAKYNQELNIKKIDDEIQILNEKKQCLESSSVKAFTYKQGKNKKRIEKFDWNNNEMTEIITTYKDLKGEKLKSSSRFFIRFLDAMFA